MPDTEKPSRDEPPSTGSENRNLPVPVPQPREGADSWLGRMVRAIFGWKASSLRADLKVVLEEGLPSETGFSPEEGRLLRNILGLRERKVSDVMIPRADIVAIQQDISIGELVKVFQGAAHSRLVAYNETLDDPVGMVHIRDLIGFMTKQAIVDQKANARRKKPLTAGLDFKKVDLSIPVSAARIVRQMLFVPPSMRAIDLLARMQATRIHLALVVDEYGGTDGIVSIEDIVEQIVGEIEDEHDSNDDASIVRQPDGSFIADARASLEDVAAIVGPSFDVGDAAETVDTIGGYLVTKAGRVPVRGELVSGPDMFEIEILDADPRRLKKVRIYRSRDRRLERNRELRNLTAQGAAIAAAGQTTPPPVDSSPASEEASAKPDRDL